MSIAWNTMSHSFAHEYVARTVCEHTMCRVLLMCDNVKTPDFHVFSFFHDTSFCPALHIPNFYSSRKQNVGKNREKKLKMCIWISKWCVCVQNDLKPKLSRFVNVGHTSHWTWNNLFGEKKKLIFICIFESATQSFRIWQWCSARLCVYTPASVCDCWLERMGTIKPFRFVECFFFLSLSPSISLSRSIFVHSRGNG